MALLTLNFESEYLKSNHEISVIMPKRKRDIPTEIYYGSGKQYPVLWLLHGTYGDHSDWIRKTNIERYACEKDLIVVMPSALNSNFVNWDKFGIGYGAWDYLFKELMPLVYNWLPVSGKREDNYIAGLSMGGMGALQYAVGHPEKFAAAAILSWAPVNYRTIDRDAPDFEGSRQDLMIKNAGSFEAFLKGRENVWDQLPDLAGRSDLPRMYFTMGEQDFLYENYVKFKQYAEEINFKTQFLEYKQYGHEWPFWDIAIQDAIAFFGLKDVEEGDYY